MRNLFLMVMIVSPNKKKNISNFVNHTTTTPLSPNKTYQVLLNQPYKTEVLRLMH